MNAVTLEEISKGHILRVGDLKRIIEQYNLPDDAPVLIERVEDVYFEGGCDISVMTGKEGERTSEWTVLLTENDWSSRMREHNELVDNGYYADRELWPLDHLHPMHDTKYTEEEIKEAKSRFCSAHCASSSVEYPGTLMIHLHY